MVSKSPISPTGTYYDGDMAELAGRWILDQWVPLTWGVRPLVLWCASCRQVHAVSGFGWRVTVPGALSSPCHEAPRVSGAVLRPPTGHPEAAPLKWCPACQVTHPGTAFGPKATYCRASMNRRGRARTAQLQGQGLTAAGRPRVYRLRAART